MCKAKARCLCFRLGIIQDLLMQDKVDYISSFQLFMCGLAAGTCAKAVCHPLDVVKKRFQVISWACIWSSIPLRKIDNTSFLLVLSLAI